MAGALRFWESGKKIVAIGRNYAQHAKELGNAVPTSPFFFLKPTTSYLPLNSNSQIRLPPGCEVHHEVELGVVIGKTASKISSQNAYDYVGGYCVALDLTARNLQQIAKDKGLPWTQSKGYDNFCPVGNFMIKSKIPDPQNVELWLSVNGKIRQKGNTNQMLFPIPKLLEYITSIMTLEVGDLVLTGTPSGVGEILPGDKLEGGITGIPESNISFVVAKNSSNSKL